MTSNVVKNTEVIEKRRYLYLLTYTYRSYRNNKIQIINYKNNTLDVEPIVKNMKQLGNTQ